MYLLYVDVDIDIDIDIDIDKEIPLSLVGIFSLGACEGSVFIYLE